MWTILIILFISSFEVIKFVVPDQLFSFEFLHQLLNQKLLFLMKLQYFFANGTATSINRPAFYLMVNLKEIELF